MPTNHKFRLLPGERSRNSDGSGNILIILQSLTDEIPQIRSRNVGFYRLNTCNAANSRHSMPVSAMPIPVRRSLSLEGEGRWWWPMTSRFRRRYRHRVKHFPDRKRPKYERFSGSHAIQGQEREARCRTRQARKMTLCVLIRKNDLAPARLLVRQMDGLLVSVDRIGHGDSLRRRTHQG